MSYLLDTNALSEVLRKRPDPRLMRRLRVEPAHELFTSVVCVMELRFGAHRRAGRKLWPRIEREILGRVSVLPISQDEAIAAGDLLVELETRGHRVGIEDVLIAASAIVNGLTLVTRNIRLLSRIEGLSVQSWWSGS